MSPRVRHTLPPVIEVTEFEIAFLLDDQQVADLLQLARQHLLDQLVIRAKRLHRRNR